MGLKIESMAISEMETTTSLDYDIKHDADKARLSLVPINGIWTARYAMRKR